MIWHGPEHRPDERVDIAVLQSKRMLQEIRKDISDSYACLNGEEHWLTEDDEEK